MIFSLCFKYTELFDKQPYPGAMQIFRSATVVVEHFRRAVSASNPSLLDYKTNTTLSNEAKYRPFQTVQSQQYLSKLSNTLTNSGKT